MEPLRSFPGIIILGLASRLELPVLINLWGNPPMRWFRILFVVALLGLFGCSSATGPQYPQPGEDDGTDPDPDTQGFVLPEVQTFFG